MTKWWRWYNSTQGGYESYSTDDIQAIVLVTAIFTGFFTFMGWLWLR